MSMSVPNQLKFKVIKPSVTIPPFLQISEDDWQTAFQKLSPAVFAVYLYLAQNQNGYEVEFSPQAIANTGLMSKGTASKARAALEDEGYIKDNCFYVEHIEKRLRRQEINDEISKRQS
jgi:hypothetical protein